ncbi:phytoene desaturase family protein [Solicola sp. PLA-1-18]|uniref:phytoene desaturase family protein n=1 Tax=Solicola sp. PLA-1-18 TaxID=3380532 RepID=UPI003B7C8159
MSVGAADAVVVGAGPNGLAAANHLADAGWSVLLLEAQDEVGGAVRSDRELHPDFVQDTFSAFYPLGAASPAMTALDLESYGLRWLHAPAVLGHPMPGGDWAMILRDRDATCARMEAQHPGDGEAWADLCRTWDRIGEDLVHALMTPFPPVRAGLSMLARLRHVGGLSFVRMLLEPVTQLGASRFGGLAPQLLLAGNAGHADIPLDAPGSGLMGVLMSMLAQTFGFPVPEGGAGELTRAMARRLEARGGTIRCGARVERVLVRDGRAHAVRLADGEVVQAGRAVVADVVAPHLYGGLVHDDDLPPRTVQAMTRFQLDPGTVKVDWALDGPVPWASAPPVAPGTVHVADSVDSMVESLTQVGTHTVPRRPFLLTGQMTTSDPSRSPAGTESFWAYTHVPQDTRRDAGDGVRGTWDHDDCQRMGDRIQAEMEALAPGFGSLVRERRVLGPRELQARDANLVGGAINGGTSQLHQELVFRPVPGLGRAGTPVKGLFLGSASAHPGGGVHGSAGTNAARAALAADRRRSVWPGRRP